MRTSQGRATQLALVAAVIALAAPASASATFAASAGGEPPVTNTSTNSHFFGWNANADHSRYCITVYLNSNGTPNNRGCIPSASTYYTLGGSGTFSQTENNLADGTLVGTYPSEYLASAGIYPCSGSHCSSSTLIDRNKPQLTVFAAGTATYTNNPQIPLHIDYTDALSHPWFAGGANAAVYICQRRDRGCTNADPHNYVAQCSVANLTRFAGPGNAKVNSFDCMYDFTSQPDGPVYLCASAADQSIPDPDPTANESLGIFPTHVNQFVNPATGSGWTADKANLSDSSCGSVVLDRVAPTVTAQANDTTPGTGDLVTFSASSSDAGSGVPGPYTWDFGDNTPTKQGTNITHTYTSPGTYHVVLSANDGAGNPGTSSVDIVVTTVGNTGDDGVIIKPPDDEDIGEDGGTQRTNVGSLKVIAPKQHKLAKKAKPILLALTATEPGAFQAALTKGPKIVAKGSTVLPNAGTFGFKLALPKKLKPGRYKLQLTYIQDGATTGVTQTVSIKFKRSRGKLRPAASPVAGADGPVNVDAGPPLGAGYVR
jgi:PKD repeat protein